MLPLLFTPTTVIQINSATNNVNLFSLAGSPNYPLNVFCYINAPVGATNTGTPAFRTGTGWLSGTYLFIVNSSTITGASGASGTNGAGGAGGMGGDVNASRNGAPGSSGASGSSGLSGGPAFYADSVAAIVNIILNNLGTIRGGAGGGGSTGGGGGGGGGV